jgi:hypothetical protein
VNVHADVDLGANVDPQSITGGAPVPPCAFPSAVWLQGCSGTLVSPQHVVFAAHCDDPSEVFFGEDATEGPGHTIAVESCTRHPDGGPGTGHDFAVCRLAFAVGDVSIIPPLMGCEVDVLQPGVAVTIVGFGLTPDGDFARKHAVTTTFHGFNDVGEAMIGGDGEDACRGDSGGPVFVELPDGGGWRLFGITSYGEADCESGGFSSVVHVGMPWFEDAAQHDFTPCTDANGAWDPDPRCGAVPLRPEIGGGDGAGGCDAGPVTSWVYTCGEPFASPPDAEPPRVAIGTPASGTELATQVITGIASFEAHIEASDGGWGVHWVELHADGEALPGAVAFADPYIVMAALPPGAYELTAVARDHAGNIARSEAIAIGVDETPPSIPSPSADAVAGCSIASPSATWLLALLVLLRAGAVRSAAAVDWR